MTPYELLGLDRDASEAQVRRAYRRLARRWHPDLNPGNAEAARLRTSQVWLAVAVTNEAALALNRSRGLQEVRIRRKYYQPGDVDALVMVLELERFTPR